MEAEWQQAARPGSSGLFSPSSLARLWGLESDHPCTRRLACSPCPLTRGNGQRPQLPAVGLSGQRGSLQTGSCTPLWG